MSTAYDVSLPVDEHLVTYAGNPPPQRALLMDLSRGDPATVSHWSLGAHTGTHVDAPAHFIAGGATVDALPWDYYCGLVQVAVCTDVDVIDAAAVDRALFEGKAHGLFFRTRNSDRLHLPFDPRYVALDRSGARRLIERGIRLVGIDYLSVEGYGDPEFPVHKLLIRADVAIIEGLSLRHVPAGRYECLCLPVKLAGADGAPARVVLREVFH